MSLEDDEDDRPRRDITDLLPIGLAMILTAAAIGLCFLRFGVHGTAPAQTQPPPAQPTEVTVGIGEGQTIHPPQPIPQSSRP
jgi:hypothetical protein